MTKTVWETARSKHYATLRGREKADVAVIGGGVSGLTVALWLSRAGLRVALAEAATIGYGASGRCAGIISPRLAISYAQIEEMKGKTAVDSYAHTRLKALQAICECSTKQKMHFDLCEMRGSIIADSDKEVHLLEQECDAMKRAGIAAVIEKADSSLLPGKSTLRFSQVYALHPEHYLQALAAQAEALGVRIYEHSRMIDVETDVAYTEMGSIQAPYLVVATGYPIVNTPGWYFLRMEQRNMSLTRFTGGQLLSDVILAADGSFGCRSLGNGFLLQSNGSPVGSGKNKNAAVKLKNWMECMGMKQKGEAQTFIETYTADGLPYIGAYSGRTPNLFVATGYGGDGLLGSMIAAQAISAQILGLPSDGYELYSPQRKTTAAGVTIGLGKRYAKGLLGGTETPRCSHMGCRLVFNPSNRLWECPCHGSRFDGIGRVINAPAVHAAQLRGRK